MLALRANADAGFRRVVGIGGIGSGIVFALDGDQTLGRNESRLGTLLDARDYCKLHIVEHYIARLMDASPSGPPFHVVALGVVGDDEVGHQMVRDMDEAGIDTRLVRKDAATRTLFSVCFVYSDSSGGNITTSNSAAAALSVDDLRQVQDLLREAGSHGIALCLPEVPMKTRREFLTLAMDSGSYVAASFASAELIEARDTGMLSNIDLLAINKDEAAALVQSHVPLQGKGAVPVVGAPDGDSGTAALISACARMLTAQRPDMRIVVTAGSRGAYGFEAGAWDFCPAPKVLAVSTAGAGDALLAGVICSLASGVPFISETPASAKDWHIWSTGGFSERQSRSALDFGVLLAAYTVQSPHTIHPDATLEALLAFASSLGVSFGGELAAALQVQRVAAR